MEWNCPKCGGSQTYDLQPSKSDGRWRLKYECTKCHLRSWMMLDEGEKVVPVEGKVFAGSTTQLTCEICEHTTDKLFSYYISGDGDYLMCGNCKQTFSEAEGISRFNLNYL